jgi:hypothetical protein
LNILPFNKMQRLSKSKQLPSLLCIFFLTLHFLVLVPVMHYFCLCPEGNHQGECSCMCRKCAARKARTGSSRNFLSKAPPAKKPHAPLVGSGGYAFSMDTRFLEIPNISVETMSCQCGGAAESIAAQLKAFIPMLFVGMLISALAFDLTSRYFRLHPDIFLPTHQRPG